LEIDPFGRSAEGIFCEDLGDERARDLRRLASRDQRTPTWVAWLHPIRRASLAAMISRAALTAVLATPALVLPFACGSAPPPSATAPAASASASSSASAHRPPCERMCEVEAWCGGDREACARRCTGFVRVVNDDVAESMASCVDRPRGPSCDEATRGRLDACVQQTLRAKEPDAGVHVGLFARAWCEADASCGGKPRASCVDDASAEIRATARPETAGLYGAFRPEIVDAITACMKGPCDARKARADEELGRCLDVALAGPR
jgi:hypothetical protein